MRRLTWKNADGPHLLTVLIPWVMPLLLLASGCSGSGHSQEPSDRGGGKDSSGSHTTVAPASGEQDVGSVSPISQDLSPEAEAAFERLTSGEPGDESQAAADVALLINGCDTGEWAVCNLLGVVYGEGHGITPDLEKAVEYFRHGCEGGAVMGCLNLALLYRSGTGVREDLSEATRFFEKACELGNIGACENVAVAYASGKGVPKDFVKAATFYRKACDGGLSPGCTNLGSLYASGQSIPKDLEKAREYYTKGCELGSKNACEAAKRLRQP